MEQMFGTNNRYIQDDGCGHEMIICALRPVNSGENTGSFRKIAKRGGKLTVKNLGGHHYCCSHMLTSSGEEGGDSRNRGANAPICPPPSK